jgi:hypothetical protein
MTFSNNWTTPYAIDLVGTYLSKDKKNTLEQRGKQCGQTKAKKNVNDTGSD